MEVNFKKYMSLKIKPINPERTDFVKKYYSNHKSYYKGDVGLDLYCPDDLTIPAKTFSNKIYLGIACSAKIKKFETDKILKFQEDTGYYLYPRSSTGVKTCLRLSNSVGIIDAGYRGELIAIVDNLSENDIKIQEGERLFQICSPNLKPIIFQIVDSIDQTNRGTFGLGSTNNAT